MFLTKIQLHGFKSFAQPTTVDLTPARTADGRYGITAIVGPNGSGKSNIADAVRWVMGEQSMKGLRAKRADDVIFAGSGAQRRMNAARVALYFDNADGALGVEYREVVVTRTVYRDGGGDYHINDAKVRRMDVVDLLAHAGLGKGSHSIITQGMTDAFLNATPQQRRQIIEDAAGVKPLQIKKARALRKLDRARDNMVRVTTLLQEIAPHLASLKRQADRAAAAAVIAQKLRAAQEQLLAHTYRVFHDEQSALLAQRDERRAAVDAAQAAVDALRAALKEDAVALERTANADDAALLRARQEHSEALATLRKEKAVIEGRIALERERAARDIAALKAQRPVDTQYTLERIDAIVARLDVLLAAEDIGANDLRTALAEQRDALQTLRADVARGSVPVDIAAARAAITRAADEAIAQHTAALSAIDEKITAEEAAIAAVDEKRAHAVAAARDARSAFFAKERDLREKERALAAAREAFHETKIALARVEVREEDLAAEIARTLETTPAELLARDDIPPVDDVPALERRVARLRVQHERAGAVDPLVITEYEETKERHDFLQREHDDLQKAIGDLVTVIKELDAEIDAAFAAAFRAITKEFAQYFRMIFGGGTATLRRVAIDVAGDAAEGGDADGDAGNSSADDVQSAEGVVINVTPPGKKIADLAQLSGGERSLVSLALLFAVIAYNPPPFVVLDEVEAALDEANAQRFSSIVEKLAQRTQFIIITHNRETMRHARLLYGVTMNSDGVSRLLSVTLDADHSDNAHNDDKAEDTQSIT